MTRLILALIFLLPFQLPSVAAADDLPKLGTFGKRVLVGPRQLVPTDYLPTTTFNGLPLSTNYIYGTFFDSEGTLYIAVRELMPYSSPGFMLFGPRDQEEGLWADLENAFKAWRGGTFDYVDDKGVKQWVSLDAAITNGDASMVIRHDGKNARWYEKGVLDVKGALRGHSSQWWDPVNDMAYSLNLHRVSGTLYGKPVEGWVGVDQQWLKAGQHYLDSPNAAGGNMLLWAAVGNEYEDGSWETGTLMFGFGEYSHIYLTTSEGEVIRSTRAEVVEIEQQENGWPAYAKLRFIDETTGKMREWEWRAVKGAYLADHMKLAPNYGAYRGGQGVAQEVGDKRKVRYNFGWPDFYDDGRAAAFSKFGPFGGWGRNKQHKVDYPEVNLED
jgi:hypothetical protein